jgi:hypothetical protein
MTTVEYLNKENQMLRRELEAAYKNIEHLTKEVSLAHAVIKKQDEVQKSTLILLEKNSLRE